MSDDVGSSCAVGGAQVTVSTGGGWRSQPGWIRVGTYVVATVVVVVLGFVGVVGLLMAAAPRMDFSTHRHHLRAIRIDHGACPGVEAMHYAAKDLRDAYPVLGSSLDARPPRRWPEVRESLARSSVELRNAIPLDTLAAAARAALPGDHPPEPGRGPTGAAPRQERIGLLRPNDRSEGRRSAGVWVCQRPRRRRVRCPTGIVTKLVTLAYAWVITA